MNCETTFLVGAGRSGSTLLYKMLCLHPDVAYISNYDTRLPAALSGWATRCFGADTERKRSAWFNGAGNAYVVNRPLVKRLFPMPVEGEQIYQRCDMPLHPAEDYQPDQKTIRCMRKQFAALCRRKNGRLLVSKRTANNRRIAALSRIFPDAKFVNLVRDGRDVAYSLSQVEWWAEHTVWWDGRTAVEMEQSGLQRLFVCAKNWVMDTLEVSAGLNALQSENVITIRYEDMIADPGNVLSGVCSFLGLAPSDAYLQAIDATKLEPRPSARLSGWTDAEASLVENEQRDLLLKLGYLD
jgi:hypothetical protein